MWDKPEIVIALISACASLISAGATLMSGIIAWTEARHAARARDETKVVQDQLDKNQRRLDYNQLILNEGSQPLPLNAEAAWKVFYDEIERETDLLDAAKEARKCLK